MNVFNVDAKKWKKEVLLSEELVLVEFWHDKCPLCKRLEPIYEAVSKLYIGKLKFARINVLANEENRKKAIDYGVMGTPTLTYFCKGRSIGTIVGFQPQNQLEQSIEDMLRKYQDCIKLSTKLES